MEKGLVSIVIPCYNHQEYLKDSVGSALKQTYGSVEVIIVDDFSTDRVFIPEPYQHDPRITLYRNHANRGLSASRNIGIGLAKGELILPLDADDKIHHNFALYAIREMAQGFDIVSSWLRYFGRTDITLKPEPSYVHQDFLIKNRINCCSMYRKDMWEWVNGYDERMLDGYEDWDFWIRATGEGYLVTVIQEAMFYYRKHNRPSMIDHARLNKQKTLDFMQGKYKMNLPQPK